VKAQRNHATRGWTGAGSNGCWVEERHTRTKTSGSVVSNQLDLNTSGERTIGKKEETPLMEKTVKVPASRKE